ncbi:hypothetical protein C8R41DRAFT_855369 [Lentinula lateritia]|uniref:Uncharacterized protein n=1 Tax=Lentinula lateritia TaxID=40482 RepID=A0ABQ8V012_9AGAR|nr:hypothetical protein C8R41DRAFT_855369 [Lentinula lateritia]
MLPSAFVKHCTVTYSLTFVQLNCTFCFPLKRTANHLTRRVKGLANFHPGCYLCKMECMSSLPVFVIMPLGGMSGWNHIEETLST